MLQQKQCDNYNCPRCGKLDEDSEHALICPDINARNCFNNKILDLQDSSIRIKTNEETKNICMLTLFAGIDATFEAMIPDYDGSYDVTIYETITKAAREQDKVSWMIFWKENYHYIG